MKYKILRQRIPPREILPVEFRSGKFAMKFSRVEFYGDEYCARNSAVAKAQNSASRANYNVNFKIYIVKFYGARFGILSREISRRKISCCCKTVPAGLNLKSGAGSWLEIIRN
ncbi:hypothetical protein [uncultured Campylobacter sp.]|uniref:hypothetical protein n=1 Tax=uncultured Campylobacter sp. TaxID=218934 RepID=UPI00262BB419|nr:hypothetical protein [uncultured Campylobacter sp.]